VAFADDQEPKQTFFSINQKIDLVLSLLKKDLERIEVIKGYGKDLPDLLADPGMIEHALVNLLQNSIHAVQMADHPRITLRTCCIDDKIRIAIEDNGCGIPEKYLANIYEPSFTLKGSRDLTGSYGSGIKGTGYGMANVKKYIEQHKGRISLESKVGSGTKFTICLPVIKKELTREEKADIQKEKNFFDKMILLVEDEPAISDVQYRILTQDPLYHRVDLATDGKEAMELVLKNQYDLISLDYILPGQMNGMDIYHQIRIKDKTVPILFISGNIEFLESIKELRRKDAFIDHLSKPCRNKAYVDGINVLFKKALNEKQ
jgi:CheY-like chemotaxis protein